MIHIMILFQRKNINPDEDEEVSEVFWAPTMRRWYVIHLFLKERILIWLQMTSHDLDWPSNTQCNLHDPKVTENDLS